MTYFEYSGDYSLPAPIAEVYVGTPNEDDLIAPFGALIDTGADYSILPLHIMTQLDLSIERDAMAKGVGGGSRVVGIYSVRLKIGPFIFDDVEVAADELNEESLLGRNVLNQLTMLLDGPGQHTQIVGT